MCIAHPSGVPWESTRYFCSRTCLVVDWPSVDLGWSGPGHLGDSVLLHVPLILQQASLRMFLPQWHRRKRARAIPQTPGARPGAGTQSLLSAKQRCMTKLRVKEGEIYSAPFMEATTELCGKGKGAKMGPLKQLATKNELPLKSRCSKSFIWAFHLGC